MSKDTTIFDDVFRTLLERMPHLAIPLINEVFHTTYDEDEEISQLRNEHQGKDGERVTDSCLMIGNKIYHIECQSNPDSTMVIRMVEYDFFIALENAEEESGEYTMRFPKTCVLYLRHTSNTKDEVTIRIYLPNEECAVYSVPVIKVQNYTKDTIFQKKLLFLLPFYIMRYEKAADQIENNDEKLSGLLQEYEDIRVKLLETLGEGNHGREYAELVELITRISDYIFREKKKAREGVSEKMRGKVLELEVDKAIDAAVIKAKIEAYVDAGLTPDQIAKKLGKSLEEIEGVLKELDLPCEKEEATV